MNNIASRAKESAPRWLKDVADVGSRQYALATSSWRTGPDFLVVGTKRGGTTSLFNYLLMHPGVHGLVPSVRGKKSTDFFFKEWSRGPRWYRSHFPARPVQALRERRLGYRPISGEASPYYIWDPRIAGRVKEVAPDVRSVLLLRDPVQRAWSHYLERRQNGVEPLSFEEALAAEPVRTAGELERMCADPDYVSTAHDWYTYRARGVYLPQIRHWHSVFPERQLLILRSEDLYKDTQAAFDTVCDFLEVARWNLPTTKTFNASSSGGHQAMPKRVEQDLRDFYSSHNLELSNYLGRSLKWS